jgi:predicted extracellular nuclease
MVDKDVVTSGVVTGLRTWTTHAGEALYDAYVQDPKGDGDAATSDALIVRGEGTPAFKVGQMVTATGKVAELNGMTGMRGALAVQKVAAPTIAPVELAGPTDAQAALGYLEAHEGMLATVPNAVVTSPTTSYGTYTVADGSKHGPGKDYDGKNAGAHVAVSSDMGVRVDAATGAHVKGVVGPLDYYFGEFRIVQTGNKVDVVPGPSVPRMWGDMDGDGAVSESDIAAIAGKAGTPAAGPLDPADVDGNGDITKRDAAEAQARKARVTGAPTFTVATANCENFFDTVDAPHTRDTVLSPQQYAAKVTTVAKLIAGDLQSPDLLGLEEVENPSVLADLVKHPLLKDKGYKFELLNGPDTRGINTAMLYRPASGVSVANVRQIQGTSTLDDKYGDQPVGGSKPLFARPPLVADVTVTGPKGTKPVSFAFAVNHWMSKYSPDGRPTEPWRIEQAQFIRDFAKNSKLPVLAVGDLNDNDSSSPLKIATDPVHSPLRDVAQELVPKGERYTYVYRGSAEAIDHMLASKELLKRFEQAGVRHVNADTPFPPDGPDDIPTKATDHDVLYATMRFDKAATTKK